ncbi:recombinase family protein [Sneathiella sp. P13V-1]|uniref:recombinase family protein n=1 Tax=Sneathiella sp. P13V-1 TaxID=2697366 RepID=UPI00187B2D6F|nr:recombinase family protein [Sneathiella sp. P13V-1]MBE7635246.1 recombinase family protein [Sneathiella sp. P13V-1]
MLIGYARTSTLEQEAGLAAQIAELEALGVERIYKEQVSATSKRPELQSALDYLRDGDTLVVTKLDRLARSVKHLGEIVEVIESQEAHLRILNLGIDTSDPTGKLVLNLLGSVAQFEREMMLERQREGIAKAQAEGKYKGRPAMIDKEQIIQRHSTGESPTAIARDMGISRTAIYRALGRVKDKRTDT